KPRDARNVTWANLVPRLRNSCRLGSHIMGTGRMLGARMTDIDTNDTNDPLAPPLVGQDGEDAFLSLKNGGTEVYMIRHGDALPGVEEVLPGDYDDQALSARGRQQADALAERLRTIL